MRALAVTVLGTLVALGALAGWYYTAPAEGSGWILFVAFLGSLGLIENIRGFGLATFAALTITVASGVLWYLTRNLDNSGWVLFLAVLCGLSTFSGLNALADTATKKTKTPETKKKKPSDADAE